jgi:thermostable 8-oxoguanine DNA glycosylase
MGQQVIADIGGRFEVLDLPDVDAWVWPGLAWGRFDQPLTPAFWASQAWMAKPQRDEDYRLGRTLTEEVIYCLLGGHGAPAEVGLAASRRICAALSTDRSPRPSRSELEALLREPLFVRGKFVRYRFAAQRARYLASALECLPNVREDCLTDVALRDVLCGFPGIGPKTASWVVRNRRASDRVAILDVHIVRACAAIGVFPEDANPARAYPNLERRFLEFCQATRSRASAMDAVMWATMRRLSRGFLQQLIDPLACFTQLNGAEQKGNQPCPDRRTPVRTARPQVVVR